MKIIKTKATVNADGQLEVNVKTSLTAGVFDVEIAVPSLQTKKNNYDFSDLVGRLKWSGDPVAEQRRIRDEW
ncbi:MAG: hypothetical protein AAGA18_15130 [Verrucomicrobiota bacterium]